MKYTLILAVVLAVVQAAPLINNGGKPIPDSYIVVLKEGHSVADFQSKFDDIARRQNGRGRKPTIHRKYQNALSGFAATVNAAALKELLAADEVDYVEQDAVISIEGTQLSPPSWGLTRISERNLDLSKPYFFHDAAGLGVTAYVIDTGVYTAHADFGGRAVMGANFIAGSANTDENGHGTHVAGTIAGGVYGIAKKAKIVGVKVLDAGGSGSTSGVVAGMDWVAANAIPGKSVANMSLGGKKSAAIDAAAQRLYTKNIPLIVAAGNAAADACLSSPSGSPNTFTVAASDQADKLSSFTSYGGCVEIVAPGSLITSAWIGGVNAKNTISGTSMAAPHAAGAAALFLSFNTLPTAQSVFNKLVSTGSVNKLVGPLYGCPNLLVFNGGLSGNDPQ